MQPKKKGRPKKIDPEYVVPVKNNKKKQPKKPKPKVNSDIEEDKHVVKEEQDDLAKEVGTDDESSEIQAESKFICHICKSDVKMSEKELRKHFKEEHKGKRLRCMKLHKEDAVQCDVCPKRFRTLRSLKEHMETHSNQFCCETCSMHFKKVLDYTLHLRLHNTEDVFNCALCEFRTDSITEIAGHIGTLHNQNYKYTCRKCGKGFHVLSWFQEHDNYHTGAKPFECEFCSKKFPYSRYLNAHRNTIHREDITGVPNFHECVICKKRYQHKNSLRLHMNVHTGNIAICDICGKTLSSKEKLKFHVRIHTGYKPFSCSYCGKCFTKKPMLIEHERVHTGEKPYTCEYCFKGFSQRSSLVIHMRGHTGERPYVCHICNKGFVARAMLNVHFKTCKGIM